jgi:hypothetical protein
VRLAIAAAGILSIYFGYRLFCGLPYRSATRSLLILNSVSGALFAIFGMAILATDARTLQNPAVVSRPIHKAGPAEHGSFTTPPVSRHRAVDWLA